MARRASGAGAGVYVPGIREALRAYFRRFEARWRAEEFGRYADIIERGEEIILGYDSIWCAAFQAGIEHRHLDRTAYLLTGDDVLVPTSGGAGPS
jgi:hypothetical protein